MIRVEWPGPGSQYLYLHFRYYPDANRKIARIPGARFDRANRRWIIPTAFYDFLHETFPGEIVGPPVWQVLGQEPPPPPEWWQRLEPLLHQPIVGLKKDPYPYQVVGANFACQAILEHGLAGIFDEMGLGKTVQAIAVTVKLRSEHERFRSGPVLYVTKATLVPQTVREGFEEFSSLRVIGVRGTPRKRQEIWEQASNYDVLVVGYETVLNDKTYMERLNPPLVIFDEVHKLKNRSGVMYKHYKSLLRRWEPAVLLLTGTPVQNRAEEVYAVFTLHPKGEELLGRPTEFAQRFLRTHWNGRYREILGYRNLHKLAEIIGRYYIRRERSEVFVQIPAGMKSKVWVDPTNEQRELFAELESQAREIQRQIQESQSKQEIKKLTDRLYGIQMLQQAAANDPALFTRSRLEHIRQKYAHFANYVSPKREMFLEILQELLEDGGKVLVFSQFRQQVELLSQDLQQLNIGHVLYTGEEGEQQRAEAVERLRHDPDTRVMLATDAAAEGVNLQVCRALIHYDMPWNPMIVQQREGRIQRPNSPYAEVLIICLLTRESIEERVVEAHERKIDLANLLIS